MNIEIRREIYQIQERFFQALELLISTGQLDGLQTFCKRHGLNRVKYSNIKNEMKSPDKDNPRRYKVIDIDALSHLCRDYGVSSDWLLLNKGKMFKHDY